jgi:thioredoxin reductase (NADPH)
METTRNAGDAETPDLNGAFPRLSEEQIAALARHGAQRRTQVGDVLFREGDRTCDFFVITEGMVALVEGHGDDGRVIGLHGPGRFLGELNLLTGQAVFVTAIVREPGAVLAVPAERLRDLVVEDRALGDLILNSYLVRRAILIDLGTGFKVLGSAHSPDTRRLREFASRNRLPHRWVDVERARDAEALLRRLGVEPSDTPVVIWRQRVLRNPSNAELARMLGLPTPTSPETTYDLLIVGTGPAGLAAAVSGSSDGLTVVALEGVATGGQAAASARIENYPGFPAGISGAELAERAVIQAAKFGAQLWVPAEGTTLSPWTTRTAGSPPAPC